MSRFLLRVFLLSIWILLVHAMSVYESRTFDSLGNHVDDSLFGDFERTEFSKPQQYRRKSVEKCDEYAKAARRKIWVMPLSGSRPVAIYIKCENLLVNSLASGSSIAKPAEFPHMAAIGWILPDRTIAYYCGGSLISERWVITAGHCTHGPLGKPMVVRLGSHQLSDTGAGKVMKIERVIRHPAYNPPSMYSDLALLELSKKIRFQPNIRPACLHLEFDKTPTKAWVTGWGTTEMGRQFTLSQYKRDMESLTCQMCHSWLGTIHDLLRVIGTLEKDDELSDELMKAQIQVVDNVRCSLLYNASTSVPGGVVPSMICAGDPQGGWKKDTCRGDSGGPLQTIHPNGCLYELVGVTSFGKACGNSGLPGIYTRVSHYLEWIESVVWPERD